MVTALRPSISEPKPKVLNQNHDYIPPGAVFVGRPSKWGNPYKLASYYKVLNPKEKIFHRGIVIGQYRKYIMAHPELVESIKKELKGRDLVCFCAPLPCHADVLLEIANSE
jgi:hypothetical protein